MNETVREIMNRELFSVRPSDTVEAARNGILALGITAAPVLDEAFHPIGIVSLRDLTDEPREEPVEQRMRSPVMAVRADEPVSAAATGLAEAKLRHAVVVDDEGRAVGMVSAGDVLRSVLGLPPSHPAAFPGVDRTLWAEPKWSEDFPFALDWVLTRSPSGPGVLSLSIGDGHRRSVVWAEAAENVRTRLIEMLAIPRKLDPELRSWLERELLRVQFRAAAISDPEERRRAVDALRREIRGA